MVNIYAPNIDNPDFLLDIIQTLDEYDNDDRIFGGDFNCILNDALDKKGGAETHTNKNMRDILNTFIEESDLIDIWRKQHEHDRQFTYHCKYKRTNIFSRLDFFLTSFGISNLVQKSSIKPSILTDHSMIIITIDLETEARGRGYWKLNCSLLRDMEYVNLVKQTIHDILNENNNMMNDSTIWEFIKMTIRSKSIQHSTRKKRSTDNILHALQRRMDRLEITLQTTPTDDTIRDIGLVKNDISNIIQEKVNGSIMRTKLKWAKYGDKPTSFFLGMEKRNYNHKTIKRLMKANGDIITTTDMILQETTDFYSRLYTSRHNVSEQDMNTYLDNIITPALSPELSAQCDGTLTEEEILTSLKSCKNNKTPGSDGFPAEFYKLFWVDIKQPLLKSLNYAYINNTMSFTQRDGIISLIPKKDKDTMHIKNWRPITLLNQDYKLATKSIARRICGVLPSIINSDQTGFIKGRFIGENLFKLQNIMDYVDEEDIPSLLMSVDFEKAFDSLSWEFIDQALIKFHFGPSLRHWIKVFYTDINSRVINNGWLSELFTLQRGARQGCPLSPYIFIICAEILANLFRQDAQILGIEIAGKQFIISQYADDTILSLRYTRECINRTISIFNEYEKYSGLKVNFDKTEILPIGPIKHNYVVIGPENGIKWSSGPIRVLGVIICHDHEEMITLNYNNSLKRVNNLMQIWKNRRSTPYGKVVILNSLIISQFVYLMSVLPSPSDQTLKQIEQSIFKFIWNDKPDKIKRVVLKYHKFKGGLSAPDIFVKNKALKISWVNRIIRDNNTNWSKLLYINLPIKSNRLWHCNLNKKDAMELAKKSKNRMIVDIINYWFEYNYTNVKDVTNYGNQLVIGNSLIRINKKPIYYNELIRTDAIKLSQFFDETGNVRKHDNFCFTNHTNINYIHYYGITTAIPNYWKQKLRRNIADYMEEYIDMPTAIKGPTKICKSVYNHIIQNQVVMEQITGIQKWENYFRGNINSNDWLEGIYNMYTTTKNTDLLFYQYKIMHFILVTNESLFRWNIADSDICVWCNEEIETIPHILLECEVVKQFWIDIRLWIYQKTDILCPITNIEIIMGIFNKNLAKINKLYLFAKRYLYIEKCKNKFISIAGFSEYLTKMLLEEREIAKSNNDVDNFDIYWRGIL